MATSRKIQRKKMPTLAEVKGDLEAGMTPTQMVSAYGVPRTTISGFLTRHKLSKKKSIAYPSDEAIVAALQERETVASMAARFGIGKHTLWHRIYDRRLRDQVVLAPIEKREPAGLKPSPIKVIVTALDGSKISVPRIPTIHGNFEARP
jgi:hypothetical protein